jgi:hypothetical protein
MKTEKVKDITAKELKSLISAAVRESTENMNTIW